MVAPAPPPPQHSTTIEDTPAGHVQVLLVVKVCVTWLNPFSFFTRQSKTTEKITAICLLLVNLKKIIVCLSLNRISQILKIALPFLVYYDTMSKN